MKKKSSFSCVGKKPHFSFGLISDPQYCDADDGTNYAKTVVRRYRQSLEIYKKAANAFAEHGTLCNVVLGDTIDGHAKSLGKSKECVDSILAASGDNYHFILGNHDYYNFSRQELKSLFIPPSHADVCTEEVLYYDFTPHPGHRFIVLDGYEESIIGATHKNIAEAAHDLVCEKNHNYRAGSNDWFNDIPLEHYRYVPYNGGISAQQLKWLENTIASARNSNEKCFIFCHLPVYAKSSREANLLWNAEDVLEVIQRQEHVVAFFSGHDHDGGYAIDSSGIHHLVPPAPLECEVGEVAYGVMDVHDDGLHFHWTGKLPPLCIGLEGSEEVTNQDVASLLSEDNRRAMNRGPDGVFKAVSTPCVWPKYLTFR